MLLCLIRNIDCLQRKRAVEADLVGGASEMGCLRTLLSGACSCFPGSDGVLFAITFQTTLVRRYLWGGKDSDQCILLQT